MPGTDDLIRQLYESFTYFIVFALFVMYSVTAYVVLVKVRPSTERTMIGIGAVLQVMHIVVGHGGLLLLRTIPEWGQSMPTAFLFYAISNLLAFAGTALGLYGAIKLLTRAAQLELLLEDQDNDR